MERWSRVMWPYEYESYKILHGDVSDCVREGYKKSSVSSYYRTVHFLWYIAILNYMNCGSSVNLLAVGFIMCLVLGRDRYFQLLLYCIWWWVTRPPVWYWNCLHIKVIWLECEAEHSSTSISKAKNVWSFNLLSTAIRLNFGLSGVSVWYGAQTESLFLHSLWANLGTLLEGIMSAIQECCQWGCIKW